MLIHLVLVYIVVDLVLKEYTLYVDKVKIKVLMVVCVASFPRDLECIVAY